jgi:N-acetylneuraminic acid mutarotase
MKKVAATPILTLILLLPIVNGQLPVDQSGNTFPMASTIGIVSPVKFGNYTTNLLTLKVSQVVMVAGNIQYSVKYSLDGKANESVPLTLRPAYEGAMFQRILSGTANLLPLTDGSHMITVYERIDITTNPAQSATVSDTAYFTIDTGVSSHMENLTENSWTVKASMPTARCRFGAAVVNGVVYAIGGISLKTEGTHGYTATSNANEAYNASTDTWVEKSPSPLSGDFPVVGYQNRVYCFGRSAVCIYDPVTDSWENKAVLAMDVSGSGANVVGDKIYVMGSQTQVYDPAADSWSTKTPMPIAVKSYASTVVDGKIYVISGYLGFAAAMANSTQIYDPASDKWKSGTPIPMAVSSASAGATTSPGSLKAIYVIGGSNEAHPLNGQLTNQIYFADNDSWASGASMPKDKAGLSVAVVDSILYAIGGGHNIFMPDSTDVMQYTPFGVGSPNPAAQAQPALTSPSPSPTPSPTPKPAIDSPKVTLPSADSAPTSNSSETGQNPAPSTKQATTQNLPQEALLGIGFVSAIAAILVVLFVVRRSRHPPERQLQ